MQQIIPHFKALGILVWNLVSEPTPGRSRKSTKASSMWEGFWPCTEVPICRNFSVWNSLAAVMLQGRHWATIMKFCIDAALKVLFGLALPQPPQWPQNIGYCSKIATTAFWESTNLWAWVREAKLRYISILALPWIRGSYPWRFPAMQYYCFTFGQKKRWEGIKCLLEAHPPLHR